MQTYSSRKMNYFWGLKAKKCFGRLLITPFYFIFLCAKNRIISWTFSGGVHVVVSLNAPHTVDIIVYGEESVSRYVYMCPAQAVCVKALISVCYTGVNAVFPYKTYWVELCVITCARVNNLNVFVCLLYLHSHYNAVVPVITSHVVSVNVYLCAG